MQNTVNTLAHVLQKDMPHDEAGKELAMAMAKDSMSYNDAHCKIHHMMKVLECAEKHVAKAAFKELSMEGKHMNPSMMMESSY
ncbi:TPA: hypothetical protein JG819_004687 [Vibrio parahaemolyticus]|nr:hypothetical protein [Vibrio parahaemolyticus]HAV1545587.1 hypothetical protein [Vibrio parahaemolyticus]